MRKFAFVPLAAVVAFAACEQSSSLMAPDQLNIGVSSPGTAVTASFTIGSTESVWQNFADAPRDVPNPHKRYGTPTCNADGVYTHYANDRGSSDGPYNERCGEFVGGTPVNITLHGIVANFVSPPSGNRQLNFTVCGYVEIYNETTDALEWVENCDADAFVHYKKSSNEAYGAGAVRGIDDDANEWIVILASVGHTGRNQFDARTFTGVTARRSDGSSETTNATLNF